VDTKYPTGYSGTTPCGYLGTTNENRGWWRLELEVLTARVQRKFEVINGTNFATLGVTAVRYKTARATPHLTKPKQVIDEWQLLWITHP
jgi:hypothetical protein